MNRRTFARCVAAGSAVCLTGTGMAGLEEDPALKAPSTLTPATWPREVAGIRIADSRFVALAMKTLLADSPAWLVNHAARTFYFGALYGQASKQTFDSELLFLACALHDLGLTEAHMGELPFEIQGAQAARKLLTEAGLGADRVEIVWDGIAMHPSPISDFKRPEIALVGEGAAIDVVGADLDSFTNDQIGAVLTAFPRLGFKRRFVEGCANVVRRYPRGAGRSFMRDIGEREVPGFQPRNICDAIARSAFAD